jgi:hypothetical protein
MKKTGAALVLSMAFAGSLQARELARAGAATIVGKFNDGMSNLFPYNSQAEEMAAAQICIFEVYIDWAGTYTDIISKTPDLVASDLNTVSDLVKKLETAKGTIKEFDELFGSDVTAKVRSTMDSFRSQGAMPLRAADAPITLADVKEQKLSDAFEVCSKGTFVQAAKTTFDAGYFSQPVSYVKYTIPASSVITWNPSGLGGFDYSAIAQVLPTTSTRADFLRKNIRRFN